MWYPIIVKERRNKMRKININKDAVIDTMRDIYYTTKEITWGLKKLYIVDVKTKGKYNNVVKGKRLFLLKKHATDFYNLCKEVNCEVEFYTMKSLGGDCYFED
jgi:hypothetical protein